jgi:hypothetical protein
MTPLRARQRAEAARVALRIQRLVGDLDNLLERADRWALPVLPGVKVGRRALRAWAVELLDQSQPPTD